MLAAQNIAVSPAAVLHEAPIAGRATAGATVNVSVAMTVSGDSVNAVEADVTYAVSQMKFVSVQVNHTVWPITVSAHGAAGKVRIGVGSTTPRTGTQQVATVTFKALRTGSYRFGIGQTSAVVSASTNTDLLNHTGAKPVPVRSWFSVGPNGPAVTAFYLTDDLYFNVQFDRPAAEKDGGLVGGTINWLNTSSYSPNTWPDRVVTLSNDGLVASGWFGVQASNRRFVGPWTARLVAGGATVATGTIDASLLPNAYVNITPPTVIGTVAVGNTLTVTSVGTWRFDPHAPRYDWLRCHPAEAKATYQCRSIGTESSYVVTAGDAGSFLQLDVTVAAPDGSYHSRLEHLDVSPVAG